MKQLLLFLVLGSLAADYIIADENGSLGGGTITNGGSVIILSNNYILGGIILPPGNDPSTPRIPPPSYVPQTYVQTFGSSSNNQFQMEFVTIGNPGNSPDTGTYTGNFNHVGKSYSAGGVGYTYALGKYEISREMIDKANASGGLGISMYDMSSLGGNGANKPATGITWNEAARFVNYLNTSQGQQAAYKFDQNGNFQLWDAIESAGGGANPFRHKNAVYFLPSVDEWFKGAYGTPEGTFLSYPTENGLAPTATAGGTLANTAVYSQTTIAGPANITEAGGLSAWGTMGHGGIFTNGLRQLWMVVTILPGNGGRFEEVRGLLSNRHQQVWMCFQRLSELIATQILNIIF